jgi:type IX secretion system PorP/SprF family membrane protein
MKKKLLILSFVAVALNARSQDYHLSQYSMAPQYLNPGLTGVLDNGTENVNYRVNANYRSQWKSLTGKPYTTMDLGIDMPFGRYAIGTYLHSNRAGSNNLNTFDWLLAIGYQISNKPEVHSLSTGIQFGVINKSMNSDTYLFDAQYSSTSGMDASLPSGESFEKTSIWKPDLNWGAYYKMMDKTKNYHPFVGFSVYHINRPNESFYNKSRLPMRFTVHGGSDFNVNENMTLTPAVLYMSQARTSELNLELMMKYKFSEKSEYEPMIGLAYRNHDAVIIHFGLKQKANIFRVSYDVNTSGLKPYTSGRGALEFGVVFMGKQDKIVAPATFY